MTNPTSFKSMLLFILPSISSATFRFCDKYYAYISATNRATRPTNLDFIALIIYGELQL